MGRQVVLVYSSHERYSIHEVLPLSSARLRTLSLCSISRMSYRRAANQSHDFRYCASYVSLQSSRCWNELLLARWKEACKFCSTRMVTAVVSSVLLLLCRKLASCTRIGFDPLPTFSCVVRLHYGSIFYHTTNAYERLTIANYPPSSFSGQSVAASKTSCNQNIATRRGNSSRYPIFHHFVPITPLPTLKIPHLEPLASLCHIHPH
jgi:hypothetical protein